MQVVRISDKPEKGLQNVALLLVLTAQMNPTSSPHTVGLILSYLEVRVMR